MSYEFKGTPGPWHIKTFGWDGRVLVCHEGRWLADLTLMYDTAEANAQLIAAAPELFSVLATIVERWDQFVPDEEASEEHKRARQALAKATGGEG